MQKLVSELGEGKAAYLKSDVTSLEVMKELVSLAIEKFGKLDALFANAGCMPAGNMSVKIFSGRNEADGSRSDHGLYHRIWNDACANEYCQIDDQEIMDAR